MEGLQARFWFLRITVLFMTGATIYFDDPFYLQLMPSALSSIIAVTELLSATLDLPRLSMFDWKVKDDPRTERMLMSVAIIATSTGAVVTNEYLRSNLTLDDWMWFFAFFRIELIFGFLVTSVPLLFYTVQRSPRTDNDVEPR